MKHCKIFKHGKKWFISSDELKNCGGYDTSLSACQAAEAYGYSKTEIVNNSDDNECFEC